MNRVSDPAQTGSSLSTRDIPSLVPPTDVNGILSLNYQQHCGQKRVDHRALRGKPLLAFLTACNTG